MTLGISKFLLFFLLLFPTVFLYALTPNDERWNAYVKSHTGITQLPSDEKMGLLANIRNPDSELAEILNQCEAIFDALENGIIDAGSYFFTPVKLPLEKAFEVVLNKGPRRGIRRYGLPKRNGNRAIIPIRLDGGKAPVYGNIYLVQEKDKWLIEEWGLDLSDMEIIKPIKPVEPDVTEMPELPETPEIQGNPNLSETPENPIAYPLNTGGR